MILFYAYCGRSPLVDKVKLVIIRSSTSAQDPTCSAAKAQFCWSIINSPCVRHGRLQKNTMAAKLPSFVTEKRTQSQRRRSPGREQVSASIAALFFIYRKEEDVDPIYIDRATCIGIQTDNGSSI